tara:strand:+ start:2286 stop:2792 length:507 start_codon:yes stop_codon:yes gene_type:complete
MSYTLEQLSADCHAAMVEDSGPAGREKIRGFVSKACLDDEFIAKHLGPDNDEERKILYEDPDFGFCILAHVYKGPKASTPHDHGDYWAIYSQVEGETEMTQWKCVEKPADGKPGKVEKVKSYVMKRGDAYVYNEGDLHSPRREATTKLIRVEGRNLLGTKRDKYEVAA